MSNPRSKILPIQWTLPHQVYAVKQRYLNYTHWAQKSLKSFLCTLFKALQANNRYTSDMGKCPLLVKLNVDIKLYFL